MQVQEKIKHLWVAVLAALVIAGCSSTATEPVVEQQPATEVVEVVEVVVSGGDVELILEVVQIVFVVAAAAFVVETSDTNSRNKHISCGA